MDPARRLLFMRLQDKMNASCLQKSSQAVFLPDRWGAGLQLTKHQNRDNQRLSCSWLNTTQCFACVASTESCALASAELLFSVNPARVCSVAALRDLSQVCHHHCQPVIKTK
ncbi:hypothetical protein ILYODFUR_001354 [Ilyodon furcidens]|uniref:Uncharacterized protein n=1 Tax=Ilyodon furcidens TaxID=33524 RepID=A0ABV0UP72_9TELE